MLKTDSARLMQVRIYLGKCFRIFFYEKGWKVIVFGAIISMIIAWVPGEDMFVNKVQTKNGVFAIICACIWIGLFNSIQSICRERKIIKREHRTGLHLSSYILAHMIYELCLCMVQSLVMILALMLFHDNFPTDGVIFSAVADIYISCLLTMYASDVLGIAVSSVVKTENAAMAAMPFVLIVQLVLAGTIFELTGTVGTVANVTISKWGMQSVCAVCDINEMPDAFTLIQEEEEKEALEDAGAEADEDEIREKYMEKQLDDDDRTDHVYDHDSDNVYQSWLILAVYTVLYGVIGWVALKFVDKDKR